MIETVVSDRVLHFGGRCFLWPHVLSVESSNLNDKIMPYMGALAKDLRQYRYFRFDLTSMPISADITFSLYGHPKIHNVLFDQM